jgi:hypothetical protein
MVLIKIDRRTIRKNPTAGSTTHHISGPTEITVEYKGDMPKRWSNLFTLTSRKIEDGNVITIWDGGYNVGPNDIKRLLKDPNVINVTEHRDYQTIFSVTPDPDYLYKYLNPPIECNICHEKVKFKSIGEHDAHDGAVTMDVCPNCGAYDSFEYELEKIQDVVKETDE